MKVISSFEDALYYVNHLGFAGPRYPGWIPHAQRRLCATIDQIESKMLKYQPNADGTVNTETFGKVNHYPYQVKYIRKSNAFVVKPKPGHGDSYAVEVGVD